MVDQQSKTLIISLYALEFVPFRVERIEVNEVNDDDDEHVALRYKLKKKLTYLVLFLK